jgi:myo-inositol-1(or 4)-monophosphatase
VGEPSDRPGAGELLDLAVAVAREAAGEVLRGRADAIGAVSTKSTATDPVTAADRAAERLIVRMVRAARPGDTVLGEEFGGQAAGAPTPDSAVRWVIDPIDGTVNYVYGIGLYTVSIAAQVDGETVAGVVRNPVTGEEWTALAGGGAFLDGRRLDGGRAPDLARALVATGFGYDPARRAHQGAVLAAVLPLVRDIRRFGAASLDLCLAADGRVDAFYEKGLAAWDHAAAGLVAAEAGLVVSGLRGRRPGPGMVLAAPAHLHAPLHDLLVAHEADGGP